MHGAVILCKYLTFVRVKNHYKEFFYLLNIAQIGVLKLILILHYMRNHVLGQLAITVVLSNQGIGRGMLYSSRLQEGLNLSMIVISLKQCKQCEITATFKITTNSMIFREIVVYVSLEIGFQQLQWVRIFMYTKQKKSESYHKHIPVRNVNIAKITLKILNSQENHCNVDCKTNSGS